MYKVPYVTFSIILVTCLINSLEPLHSVFVYDRSGIIEGELWRLLTGHMIHFSIAHLGYDVLAFFMLCGGLEIKQGHQQILSLVLMFALMISTALYFSIPDIIFYGGLSGLNYALLTYLLVVFLVENQKHTTHHYSYVGIGLFILVGVGF